MNWPSGKVRETFIQYFLRNPHFPHIYVPSSSIVPRNDPSLAFVNAGMNQFKDTILGHGRPNHPRVANSQKCLRINDLNLVGTDSYHHTFFEMLGNWSFSNYFKKEACEMAWDLLTNVYALDPQRLYITYFSGGESIPADRETKEIWEDIGVASSRILPFGKDNFWAMSQVGPCGPSTEIHYDHRGTYNDASKVNQDFGSVVEIWNLVFMQYNRTEKGNLERLPLSHVVDTGAGLERLTAVLNGKVSNYDTDLFYPIFKTIQQSNSAIPVYGGCWQSELDTSYRILADHMRAVTVALSDGILPQTNHKIRRLIHRSLSLIETHFLPKVGSEPEIADFLGDIVDSIASTLSSTYPEIEKMKEETMEILENEIHRYVSSRTNRVIYHESLPRLLTVDFPALVRIKASEISTVKANGIVDAHMAYKWFDSHGVSEEAIQELCNSLGLKFEREALHLEMDRLKKVFRDEVAKQIISNEESLFIRKVESLLSFYNPQASGGIFQNNINLKDGPPVVIEWVFDSSGDPVEELCPDDTSYWVVLNRTPFFPGTSTLVSDAGTIELENQCSIQVTDVKQLPSGWILHLISDAPEIGVRRKAEVLNFTMDQNRRLGRGLSYNAACYIKDWLKVNFGVVRFGPEFVSSDTITLEVTLLNGELTHTYIKKLEDYVQKHRIPIVLNKKIWRQNGVYELEFSTGDRANESMMIGKDITETIGELKRLLSGSESNYASNRNQIREILDNLYESVHHSLIPLPHDVHLKAEKVINEAERIIEKNEILFETARIAGELRSISDNDGGGENNLFILESFESDVEFNSLVKITRVVGRKPLLVVVYSPDGYIQGRCSIPEELSSIEFGADKWMKILVDELGRGIYSAPKGQDPKIIVNLKRVRIHNLNEKLQTGLNSARSYILKRMTTINQSEHTIARTNE